jgi:hypothetical protein
MVDLRNLLSRRMLHRLGILPRIAADNEYFPVVGKGRHQFPKHPAACRSFGKAGGRKYSPKFCPANSHRIARG